MPSACQTALAPPARLGEALQFALADLTPDERDATCRELLSGQRAGRGRIAVVEALSNADRLGAIAAWILPGRTATVWPPHVTGDPQGEVREALGAGLNRALREASALHAQALIPADAAQAAEGLAAIGFAWTADLFYMLCREEAFPPRAPILPFALTPNAADDSERLAAIVEATYSGTLDCPALNGLRSTADVLASYRSSGDYRPEWWYRIEADGEDAGCLILGDYPAIGHVELVYFGVVPAFRGRGWGELLVRHTLQVARSAGRKQVVLAVDARNRPAIELYFRCGFEECDRRSVWLSMLT